MNAVDLMNNLSVIYDPRQQWKVDHKLSADCFSAHCD